MLAILFILSLIAATGTLLSTTRVNVQLVAMCYFIAQLGIASWASFNMGTTWLWFFTIDPLGMTYLMMMSIMGLLCVWRSWSYLNTESLAHLRIYYTSLIGLSVALTGVYLSNNLTVTWIFLEATTIATAGLTYHRRTIRSLEATWKYVFVSSVGIAIAYLGILMLSTVSHAHAEANLSYEFLTTAVAVGNTLYIKLAFVFIIVGYSTKMELFPLFPVGIDANHAAPAPASAFISTAMVGGGFVAIFRVYGVMSGNVEVLAWVKNVLLVVGILSLLFSAVYIGRTTNFKRLFAYSTVENSGIIALGLGLGGIGVYAAVLHSVAHTVIKGVAFLQLSVVGKTYHTYKIGRIGDYFTYDRLGSMVLMLSFIGLLAMPPSLLFRSEYLMLTDLLQSSSWWLILPIVLSLVTIMYWLCAKVLPIFYRPVSRRRIRANVQDPLFSAVLLLLLMVIFVWGVVNIKPLDDLIMSIAQPYMSVSTGQ